MQRWSLQSRDFLWSILDNHNQCGTPVVDDDNWDGDDGMFKTVTMKFKKLRRTANFWLENTSTDFTEIKTTTESRMMTKMAEQHLHRRVNAKSIDGDGTEPTRR